MDEPVTEAEVVRASIENGMEPGEAKQHALVLRETGALEAREDTPGAGTLPFAGAGLLNLRPDQQAALMKPFDDEQIDILPTGELYVPQIQYRIRLNQVFGPGSWALVPQGDPRQKGGSIIQKWHLVAYGKFVAEAWGEQDYQPGNSRTSEVTAVESAKSNGLVRCCKDLGMGADMWDKRFSETFKKENCVCVQAPSRPGGELKWMWRRKDGRRFKDERSTNEQAKG